MVNERSINCIYIFGKLCEGEFKVAFGYKEHHSFGKIASDWAFHVLFVCVFRAKSHELFGYECEDRVQPARGSKEC